jgi:flagellar protein FliS
MTSKQHKEDIVLVKAAKCYREEHVNGLSQKELILMLYDGAIKFTTEAKDEIGRKDYPKSYKSIVRARDIVTELLRILNVGEGGDVAKNLQRLYVYMIGRLIEVNFTKETRLLDNVLTILSNLRSAWAEIDFEKALADYVPQNGGGGNAHNGSNGNGSKPAAPRHPTDNSRLLSVTA